MSFGQECVYNKKHNLLYTTTAYNSTYSLKCFENISKSTIFARNYGTAAVISYNLKGIAPPVPPVQCWIDKNLTSGCEAPTLKRVGGGVCVEKR